MSSPLTNTLIKIFSKGFYGANAGLLIFLCVTVGTSFFYIETAGDINLLPKEERTFFHFIMMITFIKDPLMTFVIFLLWLAYGVKSWMYVIGQFPMPQHQFLQYSITSTSKAKQFRNWFSVQLVIFAPLIVYWLAAMIAGIIFHEYLLPAITLLYIMLLTSLSALFYTLSLNRNRDGNTESYLTRLSAKVHKSYFSLTIYHVFEKLKLSYLLTKIISFIALIGVLKLFGDMGNDVRVASIIILLVITAHSYLIYQQHYFTEIQMSFSRNLPYRRLRLFISFAIAIFILILPEAAWLFVKFDYKMAIALVSSALSIALLYRSLLYWFGLNVRKYVVWVFGLYVVLTQIMIIGLWWMLIPVNVTIAFILFYKNYYTPKFWEK